MSSEGTSLSMARELYDQLQQADVQTKELLSQRDEVDQMRLNVHDLNLLLSMTARALRQMGLGDNIVAAYSHIQSLITSVYALRTAMVALMAGSGPVGLAMLGIGAVSMALTLQPSLGYREMQDELEVIQTH